MTRSSDSASVTALSVAATILFYKVVSSMLTPRLTDIPELTFLVALLSSIGFYLAVFKILTWSYDRVLHRRLVPAEDVIGEWFYKLQITGRPQSPYRYGLCRISRSRSGLTASGIHYHPEKQGFTSRFSTDYLILDNTTVILLYSSFGIDEEGFVRKGIFFLQSEGEPPDKIYGLWTDVLPVSNYGDIFMQKRTPATDRILDEIGYPKDKQLAHLRPVASAESAGVSLAK